MELTHSKFAICAIASPLEANYIDEWVKYHRSIGVETFYIATNDWTWDNGYDYVYTTRINGRSAQCPYYTKFARTMAQNVDWAAFIDIDEFIHLGSKYKSVVELVDDHHLEDCICLNWKLFGSSNQHFSGDYSVLKRFTHRQASFNQHVKSILNLKKLMSFGDIKTLVFANPHFAQQTADRVFRQWTIDKRWITGPYDMSANFYLKDDDTWLAHFFCKTPEEWRSKQARGRVDVPADSSLVFRKDEEFAQHDINEVEDTSLKDILYMESK